jgi:hypothetical protein
MKKTFGLILVIIFIVTLIGCSSTSQNVAPNPTTSVKKEYTEDDAITTFKNNKSFNNYEIIDYVQVNDDKIPMLSAVISFNDKKKNNSCNLAFIFGDSSQEVCFASNEVDGVKTYEPTNNNQLKYIGSGAVTTSIRKVDTNEVIDYKVIFSHEESTSTSDFKIVAEKQVK